MTQIIGTREAAKILRLNRSTVTRRASDGDLPVAFKLPGALGNYLFYKEAIEEIAEKSRGRKNRRAA